MDMDLNDWAFGNPCHLNHPKQSVNHPKCGAHQKKHSGILHVPTKKSTDIWLSTHCVCEITRKKLLCLYENATNPSKIHMGFAGKKMFPDMLPYFGRSISFSYGLPWSSHGRKAGYLLLFT